MEDRAEEFTQDLIYPGSMGAVTLDWHRVSITKEVEFQLNLKGCTRMSKRKYFSEVA